MSKALRSLRSIPRQRQAGVSLLVVLVLLIVMSILGVAVLRSSAMQERMSANMVDRNEAMQAAEAGLLEAQNLVVRGTFNAMWDGSQTFAALRTAAGKTCADDGFCDRSDPLNDEGDVDHPEGKNMVTMPHGARYGYVVEYLGKAKGESSEVQGVCNTSSAPRYLCERPMFRVTSYGRGRGVAMVVLQSNVISQPQ
jgi:type IV pilus assembly protein PilX